MALYSVAKCIESRNNFTLFAQIFEKILPESENDVERSGKCNLAGHLLRRRREVVFSDRDIAPLCSEPFHCSGRKVRRQNHDAERLGQLMRRAAGNDAARDSRFHLATVNTLEEQCVWRNFLAGSSPPLDVVIGGYRLLRMAFCNGSDSWLSIRSGIESLTPRSWLEGSPPVSSASDVCFESASCIFWRFL
jgi:hypothetical protein